MIVGKAPIPLSPLQWSQEDLRAASRKHQSVVSLQVQVVTPATKVKAPVVPNKVLAPKNVHNSELVRPIIVFWDIDYNIFTTQTGRSGDYIPSPLGDDSVEVLCARAESASTNAEAIRLLVSQ
jgi:hypothetical protein